MTTSPASGALPADIFDCEIVARPLPYPLDEYWQAPGSGPLHGAWENKPHRLVYDLVAAVKYYAALASPQVAPAPSLINHLEGIYAFLCSVAPEGLADEAFRNVPEGVFGDSARSRLANQESTKRTNSESVSGLPRSDRGVGETTGGTVAATSAEAGRVIFRKGRQAPDVEWNAYIDIRNGTPLYLTAPAPVAPTPAQPSTAALANALKSITAQGDTIARMLTEGKIRTSTDAQHQEWKRMQKMWDALMSQALATLPTEPEGQP